MIVRKLGLIVNISFWAAQKHIGNVAYGMSKAATDKMTADMATELKPHGVAVVSLYPGLVRTEKITQLKDATTSMGEQFGNPVQNRHVRFAFRSDGLWSIVSEASSGGVNVSRACCS